LTQPLLVEIKGDAAFATGDCRNPKNLSSISHSLGWLFTHTHKTRFWKMSIYFRPLGMIVYYRALTVVYYTYDCQVYGSSHRLPIQKYENI
jgi:hypothetical protein